MLFELFITVESTGMTANTSKVHDPWQLEALSPAEIEKRLGRLIRHYLRTRSPAIAFLVVRHIEKLCAHPNFEGGLSERCAYLRLKAQWRWLANADRPVSRIPSA